MKRMMGFALFCFFHGDVGDASNSTTVSFKRFLLLVIIA